MLNFNKKDFKFAISSLIREMTLEDEITEFDKIVLNLLLFADDGSGWVFLMWDKELIAKLGAFNPDEKELLIKFKNSLEKWSRIEIRAKQNNDEVFARIIASFSIRKINNNIHLMINLSKEFVISVPPSLFFTETKKKLYRKDI